MTSNKSFSHPLKKKTGEGKLSSSKPADGLCSCGIHRHATWISSWSFVGIWRSKTTVGIFSGLGEAGATPCIHNRPRIEYLPSIRIPALPFVQNEPVLEVYLNF